MTAAGKIEELKSVLRGLVPPVGKCHDALALAQDELTAANGLRDKYKCTEEEGRTFTDIADIGFRLNRLSVELYTLREHLEELTG